MSLRSEELVFPDGVQSIPANRTKMHQFGCVDMPQEAFISALKMDT